MNQQEALDKLISIRHYCFLMGVQKEQAGFNEAFRTVNRLYVELRSEMRRTMGTGA